MLTDWTEEGEQNERAWPREGSFKAEDMVLAEVCIRHGEGDLRWDFPYMQQCPVRWKRFVRDRPIGYQSTRICLLVQKGQGGVIYVP